MDSIFACSCACGPEHTIILDDAGRAFSAGRGSYGRTALNDETDRHTFTPIDMTLRIFNLEGKQAAESGDMNETIDWPIKGSRIVALKAAGLGSAFIDDKHRLFVCGWGGYGRLGLGETTLQETETESKSQARCLCPARLLFVLSAPQTRWKGVNSMFRKVLEDFYCVGFRSVAIGRSHMLVVDDEGYCYSTGLGSRGQLGQGSRDNCCVCRRVSVVQSIVAVACGESHSVFVDDSGRVFSCGKADDGQLGLRSNFASEKRADSDEHQADVIEPQVMDSIAKIWMKQVACGAHHTLLLDATGRAWGCGRSDFGQLGQSSTLSSPLPAPIAVPLATNDKVVHIAAGDTHSIFVTAFGLAYVCGNGEHGQLGVGDDTEDLMVRFDKLISARPDTSKSQISSKSRHGLLEEGEHPYWDQVQRGSVEVRECDRHRPTLMRLPATTRIVTAAAGRHHSVLIDDKGGVWVCGSGQFGELGCGEMTFFASPTLVPNTGASPITMDQLRKEAEERRARSSVSEPPAPTSSKEKGLFGDGLESAVFDEPIEPTRKRAPSHQTAPTAHVMQGQALYGTEALPLALQQEHKDVDTQLEAKPAEVVAEVADDGSVHVMADGSLVHAFTSGIDFVEADIHPTTINHKPSEPAHPLDGS
eukprot:c3765_g1_i1.p1 GENE.c3765_g1_i1~~c3765_g1_i1.p1  ORF type:complete len:659 (+),score=150.72 c3765_g1_i1:45-1979(+)